MLPLGLGALALAGAQLRDRVGRLIPAGNRRRAFGGTTPEEAEVDREVQLFCEKWWAAR